MSKPCHIFMIAGEASGDKLGAAMMAGLHTLGADVSYDGVGGPLMAEQGLKSRFPMDELSVMGLTEVLPRYFALKARIRELVDTILADPPDVLLTIDSPDFCLRVAKAVKAEAPHIKTVHYVAPSVWAWRARRAVKMSAYIDHVLALLPFEPPLMEAAGMSCDFVGHPIAHEVQASDDEIRQFRQHYKMEGQKLILALPGSRLGEVSRLMPHFGESLKRVLLNEPNARVAIFVTRTVEDKVQELAKDWPFEPLIFVANAENWCLKRTIFRAADVALAASGTVSLELAAAQTPMVIAYDVSKVSWFLLSRLVSVDTVTLVNLVSQTKLVPECLGPNCRPDKIAPYIEQSLAFPNTQANVMRSVMETLRQGDGAGVCAAQSLLRQVKTALQSN